MFSDLETRSRLDLYDEIKSPLLTSLILCDTGRDAIVERQAELRQIMLNNVSDLRDSELLTQEE